MDARKPIAAFAAFDKDGRMLALVAEGLPEWPADLGTVEDTALGELETAYLAEFERLAVDDQTDVAVLTELAQHVAALRVEAAARLSASGDGPDAPEVPEVPTPLPDDPAPTPELSADDRAAQIARLRTDMESEATPAAPLPEGPTVTRDDLMAVASVAAQAGATAAVAAMRAEAQADLDRLAESAAPLAPVQPRGGRVTAAELSGYRPSSLAPAAPDSQASRVGARLIAAPDTTLPNGSQIDTMGQLVDVMSARHRALGRGTGVDDESVPVAMLDVSVPEELDLRDLDWSQARAKVQNIIGKDAVGIDPWTGKEALVAAGGIAAPRVPYYPQLVIAQGARPVRDALPTFAADRGGISLVLPPSLADITGVAVVGQFADGTTVSGATSLVSATAAFVATDVGSAVYGPNFAAGTRIASVTNGTTVVLDRNAIASATTSATFALAARNPNNLGGPIGLQTAAADAAGNGIKLTYDVPNGTPATFDVYAVYASLQFSNLNSRTFPERVEAVIRLVDALTARIAETQMLDVITAWSTLFTGAKTFGTARQLLAQWGRMAAWYRNSERMDPAAVLRLGIPAWAINAMRGDYLSTFIGGGAANWGLSDDEILGFLQEHRLVPFLYQDGPSDVSQLFSVAGLSGATNTGTNTATPIAIPDYPGSGATTSFRNRVVSFMWAEGTWLAMTTGELNLGLVRDSILNSQNKFRNFQEEWETPAFVGTRSLRAVHTVASDGSYAAAASVTLGVGSGL